MYAVPINAVMNIIMATTLIFCIGDLDSVINTSTGQPVIQIFHNATQSYVATNIMIVIIVILLVSCAVSEVATASRQIWLFARDRGLPGSAWISYVSPDWNIPLRAVGLTLLICALLSLVNISSPLALNAINSLGGVSILFSYCISICCFIYRRLWGEPLPPRRWSLGRYGLAVDLISLAFVLPVFFLLFWPLAQPVTPENLNWSPVMFVAMLLVAFVYYVFKAGHEFTGPVVLVKRDD